MLQTLLPASGAEEHSVLLPAVPEIVWSLIVLLILFAVMFKLVYPRYIELLDERANKIESGLNQAEEAKKQLEQADLQASAEIRKAQEEAAKIRSEALDHAKQIVAEAKLQATEEANRIAVSAQKSIQAERQAAEISLRTEVGLLAAELAQNIVGEQLKDRELSARVVDRFLDQLEAKTEESVVS